MASYAKCITKPGLNLSPSDEGCITRCSDRFLEACTRYFSFLCINRLGQRTDSSFTPIDPTVDIVSKAYISRVSKERESATAGGMGGEGLM